MTNPALVVERLQKLERCIQDQIAAAFPPRLQHAAAVQVFDLYEWLVAVKEAGA